MLHAQVRHHSHWGADIRALLACVRAENVITHPICVHVFSTWQGRDKPVVFRGTRRAKRPGSPPPYHSSRKGAKRQHLQHREADVAGTDLKHGGGVVPTKDEI